jgi:transcriptional regulator with XRE-family HTH domain
MTRNVVRALGAEVQERRRSLRWSQEELAERAGVSRNTIGFIERAQRVASIEMVERLAEACGLSLSELFARVERRLR